MSLVSPRAVLARVARQVPEDCRRHIIVIGSLAAGYQLFPEAEETPVRTKDIDCILVPRIEAVRTGKAVADALLAAGWRRRSEGQHAAPGTASTPDDDLPVVRLYPPDSPDWFIELLTVQEAADDRDRAFERVVLSDGGHYAVASFRYLDVAAHRAIETPEGLRCARLAMLVLSNLLRNPVIRPERMQTPGGPGPRRSNKDLGRVLTIARLAGRAAAAEWAGSWAEALRTLYPGGWTEPAGRVGAGIRALMESEGDLREALEVSRAGLLASLPTSVDEFRVVARNGSCWTPSSRSRTPPVAPLRASDDVRHHRDLPVFVVLGDVELPADPSRRAQACRLAGAEPVMARLPGCRGGRCAHLYATQAGFHS